MCQLPVPFTYLYTVRLARDCIKVNQVYFKRSFPAPQHDLFIQSINALSSGDLVAVEYVCRQLFESKLQARFARSTVSDNVSSQAQTTNKRANIRPCRHHTVRSYERIVLRQLANVTRHQGFVTLVSVVSDLSYLM